MIRESIARSSGLKIRKSSQQAFQADGSSPIDVIGEVDISFSRNRLAFHLNALVCTNIDDDIIGGIPFMKDNDIIIHAAKESIIFSDKSSFCYADSKPITKGVVRRTQAQILQSGTEKKTVFPGEFVELNLPIGLHYEKDHIAVEPRPDHTNSDWPSPRLVRPVAGKVRLLNETKDIIVIPRKQHLCQAIPLVRTSKESQVLPETPQLSPESPQIPETSRNVKFLDPISVNTNLIGPSTSKKFAQLHEKYDNVFNPKFPGYNGKAGDIKGIVNMGPTLPPQRKGKVPQYSRDKLEELQSTIDNLESSDIFGKPEDVHIVAEYLNPSFLVKKSSGGHRLVTAFSEVASYAKPQPSLMPDVDSTLRQIASWKYIIKTDLQKAFYQIPLSKESIKFCGISTPFKRIRVYKRCAMGMPGSEIALKGAHVPSLS